MSKDEMIEEMEQVLQDEQIRIANSVDGFKQLMKNGVCNCHATALYNAGYRKVGEDMVIIDREAWENTRKNYARLCAVFHEAKRETAREILRWMDEPFTGKEIRKLIAENFGIELE